MRRTKKIKKADAILISDIHLREQGKNPISRTDDYWQVQWKKLDFVSDLQRKHSCPVLNAGDLYDHWKTSPHLSSETIDHIPNEFYSVYGNHDLPQNTMELAHKCGLHLLYKAGKVNIVNSGHWNENDFNQHSFLNIKGRTILLWHKYIYQKKEHWKSEMGGKPAGGILRKITKRFKVDLIVTGDNHEAFVEEYNGSLLVNPGSLIRSTAKQIDFKPRVYLWYADTNTVKPVYIPIEKGVISRDHLEKEEQRDERLNAFVSSLDNNWEGAVDVNTSFKLFFETNKTEENVKRIILNAIDYA